MVRLKKSHVSAALARSPLTPGIDCSLHLRVHSEEVLQPAGCFAASADYCANVDASTGWARMCAPKKLATVGTRSILVAACLSQQAMRGRQRALQSRSAMMQPIRTPAGQLTDASGARRKFNRSHATHWVLPSVQLLILGLEAGTTLRWPVQMPRSSVVTPLLAHNACEDAPRGPTGAGNPPWEFLEPSVTCPLTVDGCAETDGCSVVGTACMLTHCASVLEA